MNIKNIVLASLLALASLEIQASLSDLGYAGAMNSTSVFKWAKSDPAKAYAALHSGLNFNDTQLAQLHATAKGYVPGSTTPPVDTGKTPAEIAAEKAEADRLEREAERQAAEAKAAEQAAERAAQAAADAAAKAAKEAADAAAADAAAAAGKAGEDKAAQDAAAQAAAEAANQSEALQLVQDIATKVNATPYSGNLKAALDNKAPLATRSAHRSVTLGRLGKDTVKKNTKAKRNQKA